MKNFVKHLFIYPIKGLAGIEVDHAEVLSEGLMYDRRWMLVDKKDVFISQRTDSKLALMKTEIKDKGIEVSFERDSIIIPHMSEISEFSNVTVWDHCVPAAEMDSDYNEWFSDHLNLEVRLVKHTAGTKRIKTFPKAPFEAPVSFADGYPILVLGEESLNFLNEKLESKLGYDRFRPNIVVSTTSPHEEDGWNKMDIGSGSVKLKVIKPCARCVVITIDQQNGVKGREPLRTLSTYRKDGNAIYFGANAIVINKGTLRVGDQIILSDK